MKTEIRYYSNISKSEIRSGGKNSRTVIGYALKFGVLSQDLGGFFEKIDSRALENADLSDVVALFNHDNNLILARTSSNTLKLEIDSVGLRYEFEAPNTTAGNDLLENINRGDITGSSFRFIVEEDTWDQAGKVPVRTIWKFNKIIDVAPVVFPAYKDTEVYKRALESMQQEFRSINHQNNETKMKRNNFSLLETIKQSIEGRYSKEVQQVLKRGEEIAKKANIQTLGIAIPIESRAITSDVGNTAVFDFIDPFREALVLTKAGAKYITNLVSDVSLPVGNGVKVFWEAEGDEAQDGSNTFGKVTFTPKRLTAYVTISKQLLLQTGGNAEQIILDDFVKAVANKLELTCFGKHAKDAKIPDGFFSSVLDADLAISGTISRNDVLELESIIGADNVGRDSRAYIVNEAGNTILKKTPKITGSDKFLLEGGTMNDFPVFVTNSIPSELTAAGDEHGIVYGNFSDLIIAQWGLLDIVVDPYTAKEAGAIEVCINAYLEVKPRNKKSFAVGSFK